MAGQSLPTVSIGDVSRLEGNSGASPLTFTVTLSAPVAASVTVMYATQDGTATEGSDYTAASGLLTFSPGQSSLTLSVSVLGDVTVESNEAFGVVLSGAVNATIGRAVGVGVILDDDPAAAQSIAAGGHHTCAVTPGGRVKCWGLNRAGQVGNGTTGESVTTPAIVVSPVAGLATEVTRITAGEEHTCVIVAGGQVQCWGANVPTGQGVASRSSSPVILGALGSRVSSIAAGRAHTCAVTGTGGVKCWGENINFQLGNGSNATFSDPVDVVGLASGVKAVAAGSYHSCALMVSGGVKCWGAGLAIGEGALFKTPMDVVGLSGPVSSITAGEQFTCALMVSGSVQCWGANGSGQLGDGTTIGRSAPGDVIGINSPPTSISAGRAHVCVINVLGEVVCWGNNAEGELGIGTSLESTSPVVVPGLTSGCESVAAGRNHTCAMLATGAVKCFGANYNGAIGDGTAGYTTFRRTPANVTGLKWTPNRPQGAWHGFFAIDALETPYVGDFDGDLRADLITFTRQNPNAIGDVYVSLSKGTRFGATDVSTKWHDSFAITTDETVVIGDYDGDGKDDIATWLGRSTRQVYVARSLGTGMTTSQLWVSSIGSAPTDFLASGDANGDGKADLIMFARTEGKVYVALSDGTKFGTPTVWHPFFAVSTYERPRVADVDGDGRSDIVTFATDSPSARGDVYVAMSNGTAFRAANGSPNSDKWHDFFAVQPTEEIRIGDLNGDGKDDFFTFLPPPFAQAYTVLSQGTSMAPNVLWLEPVAPALGVGDTVFVGDVNGDGRADIIIFAQSEGKVYVSLAP